MSAAEVQQVPCELRPRGDASEPLPISGWWFPGVSDERATAILSWASRRGSTYCIPGLGRESKAEPLDVVVLLDNASEEDPVENSKSVPKGSGAVPLGVIEKSRRVWTTVDSMIVPEPSPADWNQMLPTAELAESSSHRLVWLPHRHPVLLEPEDSVDVVDWVLQPDRMPSRWRAPCEPPGLIDRIASLGLAEDFSTTQILQDAAGDVGSEANKLGEVDPADPERSIKPSLMNKLIEWVEKAVSSEDRSGSEPPKKQQDSQGAKTPGMASAIGSALYRQLSKNLEKQRELQLKKLLEMTQRDPDRALRFAIPLTGGSGFRGLSIPGAKLLERIPRFGGGQAGPGDVWQISGSMNLQLRNRYTEMANRELAAGRHRRAAYIFSELLGDHRAAADALRQGHDYHHAAIYYRDRLHRKRDAADCFEKAGEYQEAERLRVELGDTVEIARMWARAGRDDLRRQWLDRAVADLLARGERLEAAELLDGEDNDRSRAREILEEAWPDDRSAIACMRKLFAWDTRDRRPMEAIHRLRRITETGCDLHTDRAYQSVEVLLAAAKICESVEVREKAVAGARRVIIENVDHQSNEPNACQRLIRRLPETLKRDDLIAGDCTRYLQRRSKKAGTSSQARKIDNGPKELRKTAQGWIGGGRWEQCITVGDEWLLFGRQDSLPSVARVVTHRIGHQDAFEITRLLNTKRQEIDDSVETDSVRLLYHQSASGTRAFAFAGRAISESVFGKPSKMHLASPVPERNSIRLDWSPDPMWDEYFAFVARDNSIFGLRIEEGVLQLVRFLVRSNQILFDHITPIDVFGPCETLAEKFFLETLGHRLIVANGASFASFHGTLPKTHRVSGNIHQIAMPMKRSRHRFAVCHEGGLDVAWPSADEIELQSLYDQSPVQKACWVPGARLYALSEGRLLRFNIDRKQARKTGELALFHEQAILGLLSCGHSVAVLWRNGRFEVYR